MRKIFQIKSLSLALLLFLSSSICVAQTDTADEDDERLAGRFLLDLSYTQTDAFEAYVDILAPGFTWLVSPDIRVGVSTTYMNVNPSNDQAAIFGKAPSTHGLGDTLMHIQYDWGERLTASPWVPDNLGMNLSLLAPTGKTRNSLSADTWAASFSMSWPLISNGEWLLNPLVNYNFSFAEGSRAESINALEFGLDVVRLFPSKFWIGFAPSYWYGFDKERWNSDYHITLGKMFSNGMGIGLDYGKLARKSRLYESYDESLLLNFYYQFGH